MSTIQDVPATPPRGLRASIILSSREVKHYRRWQLMHTMLRPAELGYLPTAIEYEDFQLWLKRQDSGYFSDIYDDHAHYVGPPRTGSSKLETYFPIATVCHHTMHPVTSRQPQPRCPTCIVDMHLNYVKVLSQALVAAGGRAPSCTLTTSDHQESIYNAWCKAKLGTLASVSELQGLADRELEWSFTHPETKLSDLHTATKALELYWFETSGVHETKHPAKICRQIMFSKDTNFDPGRPQAYYWQRSPRYEPGKNTMVHRDEEEQDTVSGDLEDYDDRAVNPKCMEDGRAVRQNLGMDDAQPEKNISLYNDDDSDSDWEDIDSDGESSISDDDIWGDPCAHAKTHTHSGFVMFASD